MLPPVGSPARLQTTPPLFLWSAGWFPVVTVWHALCRLISSCAHDLAAFLTITFFYWDNGAWQQPVLCRRLQAAPVSLRPAQFRVPVLNQSLLCHPPQAAAAPCSRVSARQVVQCLCWRSWRRVLTVCVTSKTLWTQSYVHAWRPSFIAYASIKPVCTYSLCFSGVVYFN